MTAGSTGLKAAACDTDDYSWGRTNWGGGAELSTKGIQGRAALSMALDEDPAYPLLGPSLAGGFQTTCGWIPFRDIPCPSADPAAPVGGVGDSFLDEQAPWRLIQWGEVPSNWVNGFVNLEGAKLAICLPDQVEAWGYARYFRAANTDLRLTACVDPQFEQIYGVQAGTSCLRTLVTTGKPSLQFCLLRERNGPQ
jgi:hypothetical protein